MLSASLNKTLPSFISARLVGTQSNYGQAQMYVKDQWLAVCDKNFDDNAAKVMCSSMGYSDGKAQCCSAVGRLKTTANETVTINTCTGSEADLFACGYAASKVCSPNQYATVYCSQADIKDYGENLSVLNFTITGQSLLFHQLSKMHKFIAGSDVIQP